MNITCIPQKYSVRSLFAIQLLPIGYGVYKNESFNGNILIRCAQLNTTVDTSMTPPSADALVPSYASLSPWRQDRNMRHISMSLSSAIINITIRLYHPDSEDLYDDEL